MVSESIKTHPEYILLEREIRFLKEENKQLNMRLATIKTITLYQEPLCADRVRKALQECGGCSSGL